jgi:predicted P-loop ATPase
MTTVSLDDRRSRSFVHQRTTPVHNSLASVVSALESLPAWAGVLATHLTDARIVFRKRPPFEREEREHDSPLRDRDMDRIRHWFEVEHRVKLSKENVVDAVRIVADLHAFHPVRDYLTGLPQSVSRALNFAGAA